MRPKLLRLAYTLEFFLALIAIFTGWSEIGGQSVLDVMPWGWKMGLSLALASASVCYSAAITAEDKLWTMRSTRWLSAVIVCVFAIVIITYYYALQVETIEPEDGGTVSLLRNGRAPLIHLA